MERGPPPGAWRDCGRLDQDRSHLGLDGSQSWTDFEKAFQIDLGEQLAEYARQGLTGDRRGT
jgi:hypothetical protein